jgi:hypothetical protein
MMSLTTCPPEILKSIINFLREPNEEGWNNFHGDLLNLQLVNHEFSYLLQPLVYESISLPLFDGLSVTSNAGQLLCLIDRNLSLAICIRDLEYYDPESDNWPLEDQYCWEELKHDHKIFSQFAKELAHKSSTEKKFYWREIFISFHTVGKGNMEMDTTEISGSVEVASKR